MRIMVERLNYQKKIAGETKDFTQVLFHRTALIIMNMYLFIDLRFYVFNYLFIYLFIDSFFENSDSVEHSQN